MTLPFDAGLQPERTELAWRRTAISFAASSLIATRLLTVTLDSPWWIIPGLLGTLFGIALFPWATARYRAFYATLSPPERDTRTTSSRGHPGGLLILALAAATSFGGILGLLVILRA